MEFKIRHTTPYMRCTQLYLLSMTTKATFCQLPTPTASTASLAVAIRYAYKSPQFAKAATNKNKLKCVKPLPVVV